MPPLNHTSDHSSRPSRLWKGLEELEAAQEDDPHLLETFAREFPRGASVWNELEDPLSRRNFLQIMGASLALAGISACTKMPAERIISYVVAPDKIIPGNPNFFATSGYFGGFSKGLLVESHEGRPTKIEGNPKHPLNLGKSDIFMQAELLQLYDPDRVKVVKHLGQISHWDAFNSAILTEATKWHANHGEGVRILSNHITSPTLLNDIETFLRLYPKARWHAYEPVPVAGNGEQTREATRIVFGKELRPLYDFTQAQVVLSLDYDFLGAGPAQEIYSRDFMSFRKSILNAENKDPKFNRLYVIETSVSTTGACADHRFPLRPSELREVALELASLIGVPGFESLKGKLSNRLSKQMQIITSDLKAHAGHCLILAGEQQSAEIQAIVFAINERLGNFGKSLRLISADEGDPARSPGTLSELLQEMSKDRVNTLFLLGGNPVYDTPTTLQFKANLDRVSLRIRLSQYEDETSYHCHWQLPESHFLESWGDGRSIDGTVTLQQPLISPLYETRPTIELFSILTGKPGRSAHQSVREYWSTHRPIEKQFLNYSKNNFDSFFEQALSDGYIRETTYHPVSSTIRPNWRVSLPQSATSSGVEIEVVIKPDPTIWDGRYSNNAWLQELPKPLLHLTWGNAILLSPATASRLNLEDEDEVELKVDHRTQRASVFRIPGHPDGSATLYLGYGRSRAGRVGNQHGYNAYALTDHRSPWFLSALKIRKLGNKAPLATTHMHSSMEGRDIVVHAGIDQFRQDPQTIVKDELKKQQPTLLSDYKSEGEAWAMVIDLTSCIGCNACTIACQAENNIPVVGKEEVRRSREMHWIRVDRYYQGNPSNPQTFFQPVPCMHCEKAPCELVCPTAATNHSPDGLNQMVYNRCVGTRYCSNNCPYKVRRFNFFQYSDMKTPSLQLMHNPDVTVRSRGVIEKCTYCIQRIQSQRIEAEKEDRPIRDGEIRTACQQTCPTEAILFGDQNDPNSRVSRLKARPHNYKLLNSLGTQPRTTYLALIRNPNLDIQDESAK